MQNSKSDLRNLVPFHISGYEILIHEKFDNDLRNKISAAIISHLADYRSIDYILKTITIEQADKNDIKLNDTTSEILEVIKSRLGEIQEKFERVKYREERIVTFGIVAALKRLTISYDSCILLINLGCYFEANCIIRMIFEQLNYCTNICDLSDEDYESKLKSCDNVLKPNSILKLKTIIKHIDVGRLYGSLSRKAHIDNSEFHKFIQYDKTIKDHLITIRSRKETSISAILLLVVAYINEVVLEYSFKEYISDFEFIKYENNRYSALINSRYQKGLKVYDDFINH